MPTTGIYRLGEQVPIPQPFDGSGNGRAIVHNRQCLRLMMLSVGHVSTPGHWMSERCRWGRIHGLLHKAWRAQDVAVCVCSPGNPFMTERVYLVSAPRSADRPPIAPSALIAATTSMAYMMPPQYRPKAMPIRALM